MTTYRFRNRRSVCSRYPSLTLTGWGSALLLGVQFAPYLLLGENAYIRIHDTLEGIDYQLLLAEGKMFDYGPDVLVNRYLGGQLRAACKTGWSFVALFQWIFGLYGGYLVNYVIVHLTAFIGMYVLLRDHPPGARPTPLVHHGISLSYAWLPFFNNLGMTVAGLPLFVWAILNISRRKPVKAAWVVVLLFPFYSDIVWAGVPLLLTGALFLLVGVLRERRIHRPLAVAWASLAALYIAVNWHLVRLTLWPGDFLSHRLEYDYFYNHSLSIRFSMTQMWQVMLSSHYHVGVFISLPVLLAAGWKYRWLSLHKTEKVLLTSILALGVFFGGYNWLASWFGESLPILVTFKFERMVVFIPMLWLLLFASVLSHLHRYRVFHRTIVWFLAGQLLLGMAAHDEFHHNLRQLSGIPGKPNFLAFFDEDLFYSIDRHIDLPKQSYRIVCLGFHPAAALFNGFHTLDGHASQYSLPYKHRFRRVIAEELEKNETIRKEFDGFGNRCYLFSAELGKEYDAFTCGKQDRKSVGSLQLDIPALKEMGAKYLFSAVEIRNAAELGLHRIGTFTGRHWQLDIYETNGQPTLSDDAQEKGNPIL